ncbi:fibronectin type III-like domain-contianing protein [Cellulomonas sp. McL0617]|uniref:fibronectin type III-like domain-contianing protein n=1 Tax=Cellulomonas sp. McL0617 TaxID=3415675 RepID=UPI003CEFAA1A
MQLYVSDPVAQITRPVQALIGYARVSLESGERRTVQFEVHADRTVFTGIDLQRIVEPGEIVLSVGRSSEDVSLTRSIRLVGPARVVERPVLTTPIVVSAGRSVDS